LQLTPAFGSMIMKGFESANFCEKDMDASAHYSRIREYLLFMLCKITKLFLLQLEKMFLHARVHFICMWTNFNLLCLQLNYIIFTKPRSLMMTLKITTLIINILIYPKLI